MNDVAAPPRSSRPRVVVAEDDANMRSLVAEILRKEGCEIEEIDDGQGLLLRVVEASLLRHGSSRIDLIVSDVRMPLCSGLEVLERVRSSQLAVPVLLMTAFGEQGLSTRVRALGGRLLDKPFTPHALRAAVREMLARE